MKTNKLLTNHKRPFMVSELCNLVSGGKLGLKPGDRIKVLGSLYRGSRTEELVIETQGGCTVRTLVYKEFGSRINGRVQENVYYLESGIVSNETHKKGSKNYHRLLGDELK